MIHYTSGLYEFTNDQGQKFKTYLNRVQARVMFEKSMNLGFKTMKCIKEVNTIPKWSK